MDNVDGMATLKGRAIEDDLSDEHVRFEIFVGALERVVADADMLVLRGNLLAADAEPVRLQDAASAEPVKRGALSPARLFGNVTRARAIRST